MIFNVGAERNKIMTYKIGVEYEYMLMDIYGRLRYFENITHSFFKDFLYSGIDFHDNSLRNGKIKKGYWYLEGDERFCNNGIFSDLKIKGIEIRTPPVDSVQECISFLLAKEHELNQKLKMYGLKLAISGYNPYVNQYSSHPPLNDWELEMRKKSSKYLLSEISTVSYGPDINISFPEDDIHKTIDNAEKLNFYAPYIVPFSFSSPFCLEKIWRGPSKRTWEREAKRPTCKIYLDAQKAPAHPLVYKAINSREHGRIEFKAFDAMPVLDIFYGCCCLIIGICLDEIMPGRKLIPDGKIYKKVAVEGFSDGSVYEMCEQVLNNANNALLINGMADEAEHMKILTKMLDKKFCPSDALIKQYKENGKMFFEGGFIDGMKVDIL